MLTADWWEAHHTDDTTTSVEHTQDSRDVGAKPRYTYSFKTGVYTPKNPPAKKIAE